MHDNRIEDIEADAFSDLKSLKTLDLSLNIIGSVGDNLDSLTNVMKLNLSDNYITSLPRNAFHSLR
jgi:Leucine-rich repeat (LRR) protein